MAIQDFAKVKFPKYNQFIGNDENLTSETQNLIAKWEILANLSDNQVPFILQQLGATLITKSRKKKNPPPAITECDPLPERVALGNAWLKALGVRDDQIDVERKKLYDWLINYMKKR